MLKLPYLGYSRAVKIKNKQQPQLLPCVQNNTYFRLKQVGKHVSHYECQRQTGQNQTLISHQSNNSFQPIKFKRDKSEQIMEKAAQINSKYYPKRHSSNKKILRTSASLDRNHFSISYDKQNCLASIQKTLKYNHLSKSSNSSIIQMETILHKLKKTRPFRSQWFQEQRQQ